MSNTLLLKRSAVPGQVPTTANLALGELAINSYDGRLFTKIDTGSASIFELTQNQPITVTGNVTGVSVNGTGNTSLALTLSNTGVTAGTYGGTSGSTSNIGVFTVDAYGRISNATNVAISTSGLANGTANIQIYANGNVSINPGGTSNVAVFATDGEYVTGLLSVSGNVTGGNIGTAGQVSAGGNVTAANLETGGLVSATGNVTGGNILTGGLVSAGGNITGGNISTAGNVAANGILSDNYYYANGSPIDFEQPAGSNTQIQFNDNNDFGASANLTFDSANSLLTVTGTATVSGNITGGNVNTAGLVSATGNVRAGNLVSLGNVDATSAFVNAGAVLASGRVEAGTTMSAAGNLTAANILTGGLISAGGNITGGNVNTAGVVSATGNISGNYFIGNGSQLTGVNAVTVDITDTNGLTTIYYPTFVENRTTGQIARADVDLTYRTDDNLLTVGNVSVTGNITSGNLSTTLVAATTVSASANVTGGNILTGGLISAGGNVTGGNLVTAGLATVTGNITGGNVSTGIVTASGNVTGGNLLTAGQISAGANITGGNLLTGGLISVTGNATTGNLNTGIITASGNVEAANLITGGTVTAAGNVFGNNVTAATSVITPTLTATGALTVNTGSGDLVLSPTANIDAANNFINNVATPVQSFDAATKQYVDDAVSTGITIHTPVLVESPVALAATYAQGGTTHTVTDITTGNTLTFSTSHGLSTNDQIYWSSAFNGILANTSYFVYSVANATAVTLANVYGGPQLTGLSNGTGLSATGRANPGVGATLTGNTNGAANIDGVLVSASARVLVYQQVNAAHNGVYVVTDTGNVSAPFVFTRSSDTNTYQPASINGLDAGDYFFVQSGDTGAGESYVLTAPVGEIILGYDNLTFTQFSASQVYTANTQAGLSLVGTVFSAKIDNNTTAFDGSGNIIVKAGANLTTPNIGAATGTSVSVTGNVTAGNVITPGVVTATGNVTGSNLLTAGIVSAVGNVTGGNLVTAGSVSASGNVLANNVNITNSLTGTVITVTGNVTSGNILTGGLISATANVTGGNILTAGLISATGNVTAGNIDTGIVTASGNITGGNILTAGLISAGANVTGGNILTTGLISATGTVSANNFFASNIANVDTIIVRTLANVISTTISISNITGALRVAGGVGVTGNIYADNMYLANSQVLTVDSTIDGGTY